MFLAHENEELVDKEKEKLGTMNPKARILCLACTLTHHKETHSVFFLLIEMYLVNLTF